MLIWWFIIITNVENSLLHINIFVKTMMHFIIGILKWLESSKMFHNILIAFRLSLLNFDSSLLNEKY